MLFGRLWLCSQLGGEGSSSLGRDTGCSRGHRGSHLLPTRSSPGPHREPAMEGTSGLGLSHCPPAVDHTCSLRTAEAKSVAGTWRGRRPALWGSIGLSLAAPPSRSPEGFLGPVWQGPCLWGGISRRSLSPGHPVPAGAASQHTLDKLDTPTLKIPDGSFTGVGGQWQAPQEGVVVPLLVSASERDASGSFAAWHPRPKTACPCRHLLCPPGM